MPTMLFLPYSVAFIDYLTDFKKFSMILRDIEDFSGISINFKVYSGIWKDFKRFLWFLKYFLKIQEIFKSFRAFYNARLLINFLIYDVRIYW